MRQRHFLLAGFFVVSVGVSALRQQRISAAEAKNHVGETAAVWGTVAANIVQLLEAARCLGLSFRRRGYLPSIIVPETASIRSMQSAL
jgi:hypothetical protein